MYLCGFAVLVCLLECLVVFSNLKAFIVFMLNHKRGNAINKSYIELGTAKFIYGISIAMCSRRNLIHARAFSMCLIHLKQMRVSFHF